MESTEQCFHILLVEDEPDQARMLTILLGDIKNGHTYTVELATSGEAALKRLECPDGIDVILLDLGLPDLEGLDTLRAARAATVLPIVVLSASDEKEMGRAALREGAQDYLTKPCDIEDLNRSLVYAVERHARMRVESELAEKKRQLEQHRLTVESVVERLITEFSLIR